ncbi:MAG TPA: hypothetical protein VGJ37_13815 [Pyrinomonadaceae bacterium]|jgi:hypothetical protein
MAATKIGVDLALLILVLPSTLASAQTRPNPAGDRITITRRKITLLRTGETARNFPERRKAVVIYPVISGLRNQAILRRVRAILRFANIFGSTLDEYRENAWLEEFDYRVNYNQHYILDLTFTETGSAAYPDTHHQHFTIDLRRGSVVKARDVFLADRLDELASLVNEKLQQELKDSTPEILKGGDISASDLRDLHEALRFGVENLNDFEVSNDRLVFLYDAGFPHVIQALEPDGRYGFTYKELKPYLKADGLLWQFVD